MTRISSSRPRNYWRSWPNFLSRPACSERYENGGAPLGVRRFSLWRRIALVIDPVIKIVSFLIFAAAVAFGGALEQTLGAALLLITHVAFLRAQLAPALRMLRRMRWFFLSIAVVYLLFTPGRLLFATWPWGPTYAGLAEGGQRIAALVLIVLAVNLLLRTTERGELISAILWCLWPLAWLGLPRERLAIRIALTLEAVEGVQVIYRRRDTPQTIQPGLRARLARVGATASRLVEQVLLMAETVPLQALEVPQPRTPPPVQWLLPVLLGGMFAYAGW